MRSIIAVIAGGYSGEYEVSLRSAANIMSSIDTRLFDPYLVLISREAWQVQIGDNYYPVDKNDFSFEKEGIKHRFHYAFITLHGTPGENGLLQGYLDMLQIPYNTGGVLTEALTFDKYCCNRYLSTFGIRIAKSLRLFMGKLLDIDRIAQEVTLPCFVKPNIGGSSIATSKVTDKAQLQSAIERAFEEAQEVMVERMIVGTEVTCGCYIIKGAAHALPVTEVVVHDVEFFDYAAKYLGKSDEITPARIPAAQTEHVQQLTKDIAHYIQASGIIRVDYIIEADGTPTLLEVNTTPGMTDASFIPQQVRAAGMELGHLFTEIIQDKLQE
ncbi:D-alanine--D-alanine ligase [Porphyromonas circumdentaria]|uniref:D-alanine--D-alanine ligase n=1 Tax=Porphyromonas circumdentaria TaxID=29524 RepID=A0A1T4Q6S7_9PORP|nr:D-alanine--D-alanine ligase [Porphyromonas circumdentaria]MBB6276496.1 D-alanine-D-alanine ligase [Porphyromonas circumdentaria]MDO4723124.1 D-alanine--D-alanine ligase [Porphyromonas circumdentaria]SJZ99455.1 D-alanine--D-alanine ligase [Porphyromonas circumdentaria]